MKLNIRYATALLSILLLKSLLFSQSTDNKYGAYKSIIDYKRNNAFVVRDFEFKLIDTLHNIYWPVTNKKRVKNKDLKQTIWCIISNDNTLYLNCFRMGMKKGYAKVLIPGRYSYFIAPPVLTNSDRLQIENNAYMYGAVGTVITANKIMKEKKYDIHYILDIEKGVPVLLSKNSLTHILQDYPVLLYDYENEANGELLNVMLKYVKHANEKIAMEEAGME